MTRSPDQAATGAQAISAVRWTLFGSVLQRAVTVAAVALLARLLTETEYGAYRQVLSLHLILFVLLPLGFDQLYIREVARRNHFALLMAGALAVAGGVMALCITFGHGPIVRAMKFENWQTMLWLAPAIVLIQAWKLFYKSDLAARLDYRRISLGEALYACVSGGCAVVLALRWPTAWSLYAAYAAAEVVELIWLRAGSPRAVPPLGAAIAEFRRDAGNWKRFGLFHCGTQALNAIGGNAPVLIFGAAVSKASAAAFSMANYLVTVPIYVLIGALHRVAYSALAGRPRDQLKGPVLQMLSLSAVFIVPVLLYVVTMAEPLVHLSLGASWIEATAPVARWIAVYCIFAALFSPVSSLDLLLDRPDYGFAWNVVATIVRIAAVIAGLRYGVMPAVIAYACSSAVLWLVWGCMLGHLLGCGQAVFHLAWLKAAPLWVALAAMEMALVWLFPTTNTGHAWHALPLLALSAAPLIIYLGGVWLFYPDLARQALRLVRRG